MKRAIVLLLAALMLSSCTQGNNRAEAPETASISETVSLLEAEISTAEGTPFIETENISGTEQQKSDKYSEIQEKISFFMDRFTSLGTGNYDDVQSRIFTEEADAMGYSTEGGSLITYKTDDGEILRYSVTFYGEIGRSEKNYYIIDENCAYCTVLNMRYYCLDYRQKQFGDILQYSFEEYWIDGEKYYLIDRLNSTLIPYEKDPAGFFGEYLAE